MVTGLFSGGRRSRRSARPLGGGDWWWVLAGALLAALPGGSASGEVPPSLRTEKLVAWCIVPFDGKKRGPAERAEMVARLGLRRVAYDWRDEHVATFEEEIRQYQRRGIEYFAFWGAHDAAFRLFQKYDLHPQIWQTLGSPEGGSQADRVAAAARQMLPLVERTRELGCQLGLYNHGGWGGEPRNLVAVTEYLRERHDASHVGIVYNLHHAHSQIGSFAESLALMRPYLLCLNLNGMTRDGDQRGQKILPLGAGEFDVELLCAIRDSKYDGPIGIIGHTQDDVEARLQDNLDGLGWLLPQLDGQPPGPRPAYRTWQPPRQAPERDDSTNKNAAAPPPASTDSDPQRIASLLDQARDDGDPHRGLLVFSSEKTACLSCHRVGGHGGRVGPELTNVAKDRAAEEIVESVLWPKEKVRPEFVAHMLIDNDGRSHQGYIVREESDRIVLRDPASDPASDAGEVILARDAIDEQRQVGTLMPDNLVASLTEQQLADLLQFLLTLGRGDGVPAGERDTLLAHAQAHQHGAAEFPFDRGPLEPDAWPSWQEHVNRDRVYDFYAKQANHFRERPDAPPLLAEFPGLDGGTLGHWGNQKEEVWASDAWNEVALGSVQCGVFRAGGVTVPRAVCVRLGERGKLAVAYNPTTLSYDAVWTGGFVKFSSVRHGFMHGVTPDGRVLDVGPRRNREPVVSGGDERRGDARPGSATGDAEVASTGGASRPSYLGFYRHGSEVVFAYRADETVLLDVPALDENGQFTSIVAPEKRHPLRHLTQNAPAQWPQEMETPIQLGDGSPYVVDTIGLPFENPWKVPVFCGGHAFLADGSALVCTIHGDVWRVRDFAYPSTTARWRRFASGLNHALGIVVDEDGIFVLGRDQITRLHDLNDDDEADFYECFSTAYETSPAGHDFICGLERDSAGNFYTASGNQGLLRISADGGRAEVLATGFRNPDGLGLLPDGTVTVPCSEGEWTPASMICAVRVAGAGRATPHFGYRGPRDGVIPELPLVYLPRGLDNSSGGQAVVSSDRWGPLAGQLLHFSFGSGSHFLVLRDEVDGQLQGAVVPLRGEFRSGAHRGRFHPVDGQLYVSGMQGWGSYTPDPGCFQRVRYTGAPVQLPTGFRVHENGIAVTFAAQLDPPVVTKPDSHFAQCWNYRYGPGYGSPEFSARHFGMRGHDRLAIAAAHVLADGRTLFLELPELQPVNQVHLRVQTAPAAFSDLFVTAHRLAPPRTDLPGYRPARKSIDPHPILADLAMATRSIRNPHLKPLPDARPIRIATGSNLTFQTRTIRVRAGEPLTLTLANPDVVPHNWALARPGTMERVGSLADRLISDPDAALRHYIPESADVLVYTDVVLPREAFTIYFVAPEHPGRYPFFCTFPGHWKVMNGEMIVVE